MVYRFQSGKHAHFAQSLEVVFAYVLKKKHVQNVDNKFGSAGSRRLGSTYQHGGSQIEFVEKLCDEYVYLQDVGHVFSLDVAQHVDEPFEVFVRRAYPQKVDLKRDETITTILRHAVDVAKEDVNEPDAGESDIGKHRASDRDGWWFGLVTGWTKRPVVTLTRTGIRTFLQDTPE